MDPFRVLELEDLIAKNNIRSTAGRRSVPIDEWSKSIDDFYDLANSVTFTK